MNLLNKHIFWHPQLDCCFEGEEIEYCYSVGLDNQLKRVNIELSGNKEQSNNIKNEEDLIGQHTSPINKVLYEIENKLIITSGWDCFIKLWDNRAKHSCLGEYDQKGSISSMCVSGKNLVVGYKPHGNLEGKQMIKVYDVRYITYVNFSEKWGMNCIIMNLL